MVQLTHGPGLFYLWLPFNLSTQMRYIHWRPRVVSYRFVFRGTHHVFLVLPVTRNKSSHSIKRLRLRLPRLDLTCIIWPLSCFALSATTPPCTLPTCAVPSWHPSTFFVTIFRTFSAPFLFNRCISSRSHLRLLPSGKERKTPVANEKTR